MVNTNNVDNAVVEEMMDQLRKDNNIAVDNLERKRQQQLNELQVRFFCGCYGKYTYQPLR